MGEGFGIAFPMCAAEERRANGVPLLAPARLFFGYSLLARQKHMLYALPRRTSWHCKALTKRTTIFK
jgi:hypothetical protein